MRARAFAMNVIGLMSGTSMDGIDAALCELARDGDTLRLRVVAFATAPYEPALRERIARLLPPHSGATAEVCELTMLIGEAFAQAALAVVRAAGVPMEAIDLIGSHGQTVYHQVAPGAVRSSLQLGAPAVIAERTGCTVVADFRPRDIAAGGQGAPLVPYLDALLFRHPQRARAVQNIGGMANVTYLPPAGGASVLAFDTGPGNVLIDEAVRLLTDGAETFDRDGRRAARGQVDAALLREWLAHPFFRQPPPKSTGREAWGVAEARRFVTQGQGRGIRPDDIVATLTALTAHSIAEAYERFLGPVNDVLVCGGGTRNPSLLQMLQAALPGAAIRPVDDLALDAGAKEAVAFAVLAYATLHGWPNNLPAATGAAHPAVLGSLTPGANYRALLRAAAAAPDTPVRRIVLVHA
jgi:anhydro-N-acetylmuramic acid kinase